MKPQNFRKKPVVVQAIELKWENWNDICDFVDVGTLDEGKPTGVYLEKHDDNTFSPTFDATDYMGLYIPTTEGLMLAVHGDWIIKGVNGEFYPCRPDVFAKTYELVKEEGSGTAP